MKNYVNEILGGEYLEDEKDNEFEEKFGFSLIDLEEKMNDWLNDRFICYSVKELAYEICDRVYDILGIENADYNIAYKLKKCFLILKDRESINTLSHLLKFGRLYVNWHHFY